MEVEIVRTSHNVLAQRGTQRAPWPDPTKSWPGGCLALFRPNVNSLGTPQVLSHSFEGLLSGVSILVKTIL